MSTKNITVIAIKLLTIYLFFQIIPAIVSLLHSILEPEFRTISVLPFQILHLVIYITFVVILFKYSGKMANKITEKITDESVDINLSSVNLLTILIAAGSVSLFISAIPTFINQVYGFIVIYESELLHQPEKQRITKSVIGVLGISLQVALAILAFFNAKKIAIYWEDLNSDEDDNLAESESE